MAIINAIKVTLDSNMNTKWKMNPLPAVKHSKDVIYLILYMYLSSLIVLEKDWAMNGIFIRNAYLLHAYIVDICMPNDMRRPYIRFHISFLLKVSDHEIQ